MSTAINIEQLHKNYGDIKAVNGINLNVIEGEMFGLVGPDGAGKTTTIRILCGLLKVDSGSIKVSGSELKKNKKEIQNQIGYLSQALNAKGENSVKLETLHWFTVEFGLINNPEGRRIYGSGVLSSLKEVQHSLSDKVEVKPFHPEKIVVQQYDVWHLQPILFAIDSFEQLEDGFYTWCKKEGLLT